jgi:porphobilinogen synthase
LLFSRTDHKDAIGSASHSPSAAMQKGIYAIKSVVPDMMVISDVCLCPYTNHGHCGLVGDYHGRPIIENDSTLEVLNEIAISHAQAGVDVVAPSGNIDGMVQSIRQALDKVNHWPVAILSYSAKYASSFYGPFREAVDSAPQFGDRNTYQLNPANRLEALREIELDVQEGADMVIVKPALAYLDIIREARGQTKVPIVGYQVSGEYAMIKAAAEKGWLKDIDALYESLLCIKRAGASMIVTYAAPEMAALLRSRTA